MNFLFSKAFVALAVSIFVISFDNFNKLFDSKSIYFLNFQKLKLLNLDKKVKNKLGALT